MTTELNLTIRGETAADVMLELATIGSRAGLVLGVGAQEPDPEPTPAPKSVEKPNGPDAPAPKAARGKKVAPQPEPEAVKGPDREAVIDGLTKIYGKGDAKIRAAITAFRDGHGADRLRDLKDDVIPEAAALLADLKLAESPDAP